MSALGHKRTSCKSPLKIKTPGFACRGHLAFQMPLAGHITLQVFARILGIAGAILPLAMVVALIALELLVAFLQAYVFAILTCIYLNDAIHPGH
jgi:hypothetical protein